MRSESVLLSAGWANGDGMNLVPDAEQTAVVHDPASWLAAMAWEIVGIIALSKIAMHANHAMK